LGIDNAGYTEAAHGVVINIQNLDLVAHASSTVDAPTSVSKEQTSCQFVSY
jgi:hypothetical protein